jgi:hypothetical protein
MKFRNDDLTGACEFVTRCTKVVFGDTGFTDPNGLAFDSAGNLFVADEWAGNNGQIDEVTPNGTKSLLANDDSGGPSYIAVGPVPEPSSTALLGLAFPALLFLRLIHRRRPSAR